MSKENKMYPICLNIECEANNPEYGNHCAYFTAATCCIKADIAYRENYLRRAIAWLKKYYLHLLLMLGISAVIIILAYVNWVTITGGL